VQSTAATLELGGEVLQENIERPIIEAGVKLQSRFPQAFDFDSYNPDLLSSDPIKRDQAFNSEVERRLGKTLGTKLKNNAREIIDGVQNKLQETGAIDRLRKDAEEGNLSANNIANMINQSLPIMVASLAATVVGGPELGITLTAPVLGGFTAETLREDEKMTSLEKFARTYISGLPQAMVENLVPSRLIQTKNFKGAGEIIQTAVLEGVTESIQRAIELTASQANNVGDIVEILSDPKNLKSMFDEFLAGATLGGIFSGTQQSALFIVDQVRKGKNTNQEISGGKVQSGEQIQREFEQSVPLEEGVQGPLNTSRILQEQIGGKPDADNNQEAQGTEPRSDERARQTPTQDRPGPDQASSSRPTGQRALQGDSSTQKIKVSPVEEKQVSKVKVSKGEQTVTPEEASIFLPESEPVQIGDKSRLDLVLDRID